MKLKTVTVQHFQSYDYLTFDYSARGLALISGEVGAGKSTFLDAPSWILFGQTSKESAADDVREWGSTEPTTGVAEVEMPEGVIQVTRIRGKSSQNDLYWTEPGSDEPKRGKDLSETQKKLEERLGVTAELFFTSCYMTQFSDGGTFFVAKAKERRATFEKIADLSVPKKLAERTSDARKSAKSELERSRQDLARCEGKLDQVRLAAESAKARVKTWKSIQNDKICDLKLEAESFEETRTAEVEKLVSKLEELDQLIRPDEEFKARDVQLRTQLKHVATVQTEHRLLLTKVSTIRGNLTAVLRQKAKLTSLKSDQCPTCLGPTKNANMSAELRKLSDEESGLVAEETAMNCKLNELTDAVSMEAKLRKDHEKLTADVRNNDALIALFRELQAKTLALRDSTNRAQERYDEAFKEKCPYTSQVKELGDELVVAGKVLEDTQVIVAGLEHRVASLTWLYDRAATLRGMLLEKAVRQVSNRMNAILEEHFDADLRVSMTLADGDELDVEINNAGYPCKFKQLSGGERSQLKLAFNLALLKASQDCSGTKFDLVMFDEALNGMTDGVKRKAFGVFQELEKEHETVLLIDHSEGLKSLFDTEFRVTKDGNHSHIENVTER